MLVLWHIFFLPFFALNSRKVAILWKKVRCFGHAKASLRHLDGDFVGNLQLSVSYAVIFSDARF